MIFRFFSNLTWLCVSFSHIEYVEADVNVSIPTSTAIRTGIGI